MANYYKTNPKIKHTDKNGARVADRMPTNVSKALPPEPILTIMNSLDILEKQISSENAEKIVGDTVPLIPKTPHSGGNNMINRKTPDVLRADISEKTLKRPKLQVDISREANIQNSFNTSQEAIMQNSEDKKVKSVWENKPLIEKRAKTGETYFEPRSDSDFVEKENIPVSKAVLLCKLDKQIIQLENKGISDELVLKAYGSFDDVPDELRKQENRPPANWFTKALETMYKSDYTGNAERYCIELWKSADSADDLIQKTLVKPLDGDEFFEREKLVEDAEEGGEAEEVIGDGGKVKTSDIKPMQTTSTN